LRQRVVIARTLDVVVLFASQHHHLLWCVIARLLRLLVLIFILFVLPLQSSILHAHCDVSLAAASHTPSPPALDAL
jgi:hypothetical protein